MFGSRPGTGWGLAYAAQGRLLAHRIRVSMRSGSRICFASSSGGVFRGVEPLQPTRETPPRACSLMPDEPPCLALLPHSGLIHAFEQATGSVRLPCRCEITGGAGAEYPVVGAGMWHTEDASKVTLSLYHPLGDPLAVASGPSPSASCPVCLRGCQHGGVASMAACFPAWRRVFPVASMAACFDSAWHCACGVCSCWKSRLWRRTSRPPRKPSTLC